MEKNNQRASTISSLRNLFKILYSRRKKRNADNDKQNETRKKKQEKLFFELVAAYSYNDNDARRKCDDCARNKSVVV